jgi:hypothetical protein
VREDPQKARGELRNAFVDGDDAAHMQRGFAVFIVAREDFELGVQHGQVARVAVEFHLAEERHLHAFGEHVGQIAAVKPLARQRGARGIGEADFEQAQVAAVEAGELGRAYIRDDRGHFARSELGDGLHVAAILVAEGDVAQQVFDGDETLALQHGRASRADSFYIGERGGEVHAVSNPVYLGGACFSLPRTRLDSPCYPSRAASGG